MSDLACPTEVPPDHPHPIVEAAVQTGRIETRYRRSGSGSPLLLLAPQGAGSERGGELFAWLALHFRVIAPLPPCAVSSPDTDQPPTPITAWLRDLIDGLGLDRPAIVADEPYAMAALHFSNTDPDRMNGLVVLYRDHDDPAVLPSPSPASTRLEGLLVLRLGPRGLRDRDPGSLADAIRFLGAGGPREDRLER